MDDPRVEQFEQRYHTKLDREHLLGSGQDGFVMYSDRATAVKFLDREDTYVRERDAYHLLKSRSIIRILDHSIPELIRTDDELRAIEMKIVSPPFLLDFAAAYPEDTAPDFSPEVLADWIDEKMEQFGDDWPSVEYLLEEFRKVTGLILLDVNPGNVRFAPRTGS